MADNPLNAVNRGVYISDNLPFLKELNDGCIDLVCINPPFAKNETFGRWNEKEPDPLKPELSEEKAVERALPQRWGGASRDDEVGWQPGRPFTLRVPGRSLRAGRGPVRLGAPTGWDGWRRLMAADDLSPRLQRRLRRRRRRRRWWRRLANGCLVFALIFFLLSASIACASVCSGVALDFAELDPDIARCDSLPSREEIRRMVRKRPTRRG